MFHYFHYREALLILALLNITWTCNQNKTCSTETISNMWSIPLLIDFFDNIFDKSKTDKSGRASLEKKNHYVKWTLLLKKANKMVSTWLPCKKMSLIHHIFQPFFVTNVYSCFKVRIIEKEVELVPKQHQKVILNFLHTFFGTLKIETILRTW